MADGTICTDAAVTEPLLALLSRVGRMATQLPAVTSDNWAGMSDEIFVDVSKSTVVLPFFCATWIVLPDTDEISPAT